MKTVTWLVFIFIFIFSAIYVFKHENYSKRIEIINGYPVNFSVNRGQDLEFYLNAKEDYLQGELCIYDVNRNVVDCLILNLKKQESSNDTMIYEHGYPYLKKYSYNTSKLKSGIYFLGNIVPFIVKEPNLLNSITVVFPFANFIAISNEGGKSFDPKNSTHGVAAETLSVHRLPNCINSPFSFISWINEKYKNKNINFISDLDLEHAENIAQTNLLILYGFQTFWTIKERENLDNFLDNGGNLFAMCTYLINNKITYHEQSKQLSYILPKGTHDTLLNAKNSPKWHTFNANTKSIGCSFELRCSAKKLRENRNAYTIINKKHPIFRGIEVDSINIDTREGNAIAILDCDFTTFPEPDRAKNNFVTNEILAFDYGQILEMQTVTGIFNFKKNIKSGEIIVIGNEKWCSSENMKREIISKITGNCIDYLSSNAQTPTMVK